MSSGRVGNIIKDIIEFLKGDLWIKVGLSFIGTGSASILVPTLVLNTIYFDATLANEPSIWWEIIGTGLVIIGVGIILYRLKHIKDNPPHLIYIRGLVNMDEKLPISALPFTDRSAVQTKYNVNSYEREKLIDEFKFLQRIFKDKIEQPNAMKTYIAALGSFPSLFLLGTMLRNAYSETIILDYNRHESKWYRLNKYANNEVAYNILDDENNNDIDRAIDSIVSSSPSEVAISLGYTFSIPKEQIPEHLRGYTLFLKTSVGYGHDKLSNLESQNNLVNELSQIINKFSKLPSVNKIHLFVSAQASITIALGRSYMDNAHGTLILHNYNHTIKDYDWAIGYNQGQIIVV